MSFLLNYFWNLIPSSKIPFDVEMDTYKITNTSKFLTHNAITSDFNRELTELPIDDTYYYFIKGYKTKVILLEEGYKFPKDGLVLFIYPSDDSSYIHINNVLIYYPEMGQMYIFSSKFIDFERIVWKGSKLVALVGTKI